MPANRRKPVPADASLVEAVQATVNALQIGPADAALVTLAVALARSIDGMSPEIQAKLAAQTSVALLRVLQKLRLHARPVETPTHAERNPWHAASRATLARRRTG